jgi:hypothetical protein
MDLAQAKREAVRLANETGKIWAVVTVEGWKQFTTVAQHLAMYGRSSGHEKLEA